LEANGVKAHEEGCKETLSPAMDILVSSQVLEISPLLSSPVLIGYRVCVDSWLE
jgi:threonine synthase